MQASPRNFLQLFSTDVQYEIPVFQRQYVWTKSKQLEPLWEDIQTIADQAMQLVRRGDVDAGVSAVDAGAVEGHFLGAIVLDDTTHRIGVNARPVIDGQQRLTTVQLLISAIREVATEMGLSNQEKALADLLFHAEHQIEDAPAHHRYRVWPTLYDREVFRMVVDTHGPDHVTASGYGKHAITSAEAYFRYQVEQWVNGDPEDPPELRLRALVRVVQRLLRVVVIELDESDNAQLIFETLNARGEDLLAAELVKNFLFARAEKPGVNLVQLYDQHWNKLESRTWRKPVGVGRRKRPRVEQFLFHWLVMQTTDENVNTTDEKVSPERLFPAFRDWVRTTEKDPVGVIQEFSEDADLYLTFDQEGEDSPQHRFFTRLGVLDTNTPVPLALWLHRAASGVPEERRRRGLEAIESWLVRRALCRYTTRGYNLFFLDILSICKAATGTGSSSLDDIVIDQFASKADTPSRSWPTDAEVRDALLDKPLYGALNARRVRMVLLAIEDLLHEKTGGKAEKVSPATKLHIEHLLPQAWEEHWTAPPPAGLDSAQVLAWREQWLTDHVAHRNQIVHSIGNLTLLSEPLNESVSNGPWGQKLSSIDEFSSFRLNRDIVQRQGANGWHDETIHSRSAELVELICEIWPGPSAAHWRP